MVATKIERSRENVRVTNSNLGIFGLGLVLVVIFLQTERTSLTTSPLKEGVVMKKSKYWLYEKDEKRWVSYDEKSYEEMKRWRINYCASQRKKKACFCPKEEQLKYCNTICVTCRHRKSEKYLSQPIPGSKSLTIEDCLVDELDIENQVIESAYSEEILSRLDELMPEAREIGRLRILGVSEAEIARQVGMSRVTIYRKLLAAYQILSEEFKEIKKN